MTFVAPKGKSFTKSGDDRTVTIQPVEGGDGMILTAIYGLLSDDETGEIAGSRFVLSGTLSVMGKDVEVSAASPDFAKAIDMFITTQLRGESDDYVATYDEEDAFFSQKFKKAAVASDDVWHNPKFADNREALEELRGETETLLQTARDSETGSQDDYLHVAQTLAKAYNLVGSSKKALVAWAKGASEDGGNLTLLTQLGKGENALTEAMRLAQISDVEYRVLPASVTSGKAVDRHIAVSIKEVVDDASISKLTGVTYDADGKTDANGVEDLLRHVAKHAFKVEGAMERDGDDYVMSLDEVTNAVDEYAATKAGEFVVDYGKHVNTYNGMQYGAAKMVYGMVRISTAGAGVFAAAVKAIDAYDSEEDADKKAKIIADLFVSTRGNALVKAAAAANKLHLDTVAKEARNRKVVQSIADDSVISKQAATSFAKLEPLAAAAHLYKLLKSHSDSAAVEVALKSLIAQGVTIQAAAE